MSHCLFRINCCGTMGWFDHLQDKEEFIVPTGNEELHVELWIIFRNSSSCLLKLHSGHGQRIENVSFENQLVDPCHSFFNPDFHLWWNQEILAQAKSWRLDRTRNLLLRNVYIFLFFFFPSFLEHYLCENSELSSGANVAIDIGLVF